MTTEAEAEAIAKTKWCPFARQWAGDVAGTPNRVLSGKPAAGSMCIASRCMAWQTYQGRAGITGYCGMMQRADM